MIRIQEPAASGAAVPLQPRSSTMLGTIFTALWTIISVDNFAIPR